MSLSPNNVGPTVCVGEILVEIVATTIGDGFLSAQPLIGPYPSGAPAIFIDQCGRMGGDAAMIGAVGNDDFGRVNLDRLRHEPFPGRLSEKLRHRRRERRRWQYRHCRRW